MGVDVHRAEDPIGAQERESKHAVHPEACDPGAEVRPLGIGPQRSGPHGAALGGGGDARAFLDAVLDRVDLANERSAGHNGVVVAGLELRQLGQPPVASSCCPTRGSPRPAVARAAGPRPRCRATCGSPVHATAFAPLIRLLRDQRAGERCSDRVDVLHSTGSASHPTIRQSSKPRTSTGRSDG